MTIKHWVKQQGGIANTARILGASKQSVFQWVESRNLPRAKLMQKIYRMSRGKVTYKTMVNAVVSRGIQ